MSSKKEVEDWFGYWTIRIRDPKDFKRIRTPDWSSYAATEMAKEWIASARQDFQVAPHLRGIKDPAGVAKQHFLPKSAFANIKFIRGASASERSRNENEGQVHARQGQLSGGQWVTQSILIPQFAQVNGVLIETPEEIAHDIGCYIAKRLDKSDNVEPSPYCQTSFVE